MSISIRKWTPDDAGTIRGILHETWMEAYSSFIPESDILGYLNEQYNVDAIKALMQDVDITGYIAEVDGIAAACERLQYNTQDQRLYVNQLYVLPKFQGRGLGKKLMQLATDRATLMGLDRVWVGVMVQNESALRWYKNLGYKITETMPFTMGKTRVDHYIGFLSASTLPAQPLISDSKLFSKYYVGGNVPSLGAMCLQLLEQQKAVWPQLREGFDSLHSIQIKEIICNGFIVKAQFNPNRLSSTLAKVDDVSINDRKCFLCIENLPKLQQGVIYEDKYIILCNPAPIFHQHFTISSIKHSQQLLEPHVEELLVLAREVCPYFTVLYNGAKCGASAPDHFHFQMSPWRAIPGESDAVDSRKRQVFYHKDHVAATSLKQYGRFVLIVESTHRNNLTAFLCKVFSEWQKLQGISDEPMMNVLCSFQEQVWRVQIFLRQKHRPEIYYRQEKDRLVVSPGVVDMAGLIITPLRKDFERLDRPLVESIYNEVSADSSFLQQLIDRIK